jgi:hypothetical protein
VHSSPQTRSAETPSHVPSVPRLPLPGRSRSRERPHLRIVPPRRLAADSAAELDRRLRALARRAARCRLAQGWLAASLLPRRSWFTLGFVRLGDYTSERLGLGARILEEEARVAIRLRALPRVTTAFLDGSLTWTAVRLITTVATDRDEDRWIARSTSLDTRALSELVREEASTQAAAMDPGDALVQSAGLSSASAEEDEDLHDPPQRWSVRVTPGGRRLWRAACEMASRTAGSRLTHAQVLEQIAAEVAGGAATVDIAAPNAQDLGTSEDEATADSRDVADASNFHDLGTPGDEAKVGVRNVANASNLHDLETSDDVATAESHHAADASASRQGDDPANDARGRPHLSELVAAEIERRAAAPEGRGLSFLSVESARELEERDPALAAFLADTFSGADDRHETDEAPPAPPPPEDGWFAKALREVGEAEGFAWMASLPAASPSTPVEWLDAELRATDDADPHTIDARLREVRRAAQALDFELAALLGEAAGCSLHRTFGLSGFEQYVETRLGLRPRTAWSLLSIGRAVRRSCPTLGDAWRSGRVSTLAAKILLPVLGTANGGTADTDEQWIARAGLVTLRRLEAEVSWALDRHDEFRSGGRTTTAPDPTTTSSGPTTTTAATDPSDAANAIPSRPLDAASPCFELAPPPLDLDLAGHALAAITTDGLQMRALDNDPAPATGADRPRVEIAFFAPESVIALAEGVLQALRRGDESRGRTFERMLALALLEWTALPKHRDPIFERDGWTCAVPGCRSRRNLHDHHLVFRSHGGDNTRDNRITVCAAHHLHGIHRGRIRARGRAGEAICWELGCRFGADADAPLARFLGDRYLGNRDLGTRDLGDRDLGDRDLGDRDLGDRDLEPDDQHGG